MIPRSVLIKVPATVGNFAGAMNCAALTLDAMFNVKVTPRSDGRVGLRYFGENGDLVPRDRSNLVVRAMEAALHQKGLEFTGADFEIYSSVPVGVGLGSSTAAVLAGLIAADRLYSLELEEKTLFELARIYETRIDNLHAAWHGGFVACTGESPAQIVRRTFVPGDFVLAVVTPDAVPGAAAGEGRTSKDVAPSADFDRARALADIFSRPGHSVTAWPGPAQTEASPKNVPGLEKALSVSAKDAVGIFVCGSGPGVGILSQESPDEAIRAVRQCFVENGLNSTFGLFRPANVGACDLNAVRPQIVLPALRFTESQSSQPVL
jgi:homoserine kinase